MISRIKSILFKKEKKSSLAFFMEKWANPDEYKKIVTVEDIRDLENHLEFKLPDDYKSEMTSTSLGLVSDSTWSFLTEKLNTEYVPLWFYIPSFLKELHAELVDLEIEYGDEAKLEYFPIGSDGQCSYFCYRTSELKKDPNKAKLYYVTYNLPPFTLHFVSDSFTSFISTFVTAELDDYSHGKYFPKK